MSVASDKATVQAVVTTDLKEWLEERARAEGRSVSNLIGQLLAQVRQSSQVPSPQALNSSQKLAN